MPEKVNMTLLNPYETWFNRGVIHRDQMAHYFRWAFLGKLLKRLETVLDVGAGIGNLEMTIYRNRMKPGGLAAIELKDSFIEKLKEVKDKVNYPMEIFKLDIRKEVFPFPPDYWEKIVCFEVIEHFEKKYINHVLSEMRRVLHPSGWILLSTPNYDGVHKAKNHIHEYTELELQTCILANGLKIVAKYGTFMSLGKPDDAKRILKINDFNLFMRLYKYYNSSVLSILFAPAYPSKSRNILWVLKKDKSDMHHVWVRGE